MNMQPEVRAIDGYPVVLPCSFSHPRHSQHSSLQVLWRLGHGPDAVVLYHCTSTPAAPTCEPGPKQDQRYRLEGNPKEHDLSLRINSAALQDNGRYYCRVEVQGQKHISFEDKMGTRLRVEGKSRQTKVILSSTMTLEKKKYFIKVVNEEEFVEFVVWLHHYQEDNCYFFQLFFSAVKCC